MFLAREGAIGASESIRASLSHAAARAAPVSTERDSGMDFFCGCPVCKMEKPDYSTTDSGTTADEAVGTIPVGGTVTGVIDIGGDVDYYEISVVAGQTYTIALTGTGATPLPDAFLSLTSGGVAVTSDDDGGAGYNSLLTFTAATTGTYQIVAEAYPGAGFTGEYTVAVNEMGADFSSPEIQTSLAVGTTVIGFLETDGDFDVYQVYLEAGQLYTFEVAGGADYNTDYLAVPQGELDTILTLYDSFGNLVAHNDDLSFPGDISSGFSFSPSETGFYLIGVEAYPGQTGGFTLDVKAVDLSGLDPLDAIDWGTQLASTTVTVYFAAAGEIHDGVTSLGWTEYEMAQAMLALQTYSDISALTFSTTTDQATATFTLVTTTSDQYLGYFNPPGTPGAGIGVFATNWAEYWNSTGALEEGGYGYITLVHEFGHGLGLAHPHDNGGTSDIMPGVTSPFGSYGVFDLNQGVYTTMSYNDGWQLHPAGSFPGSYNYGYQTGPGAFDIALIQEKYGAVGNNTGNTIYTLPTANAAGTFYQVIWDTGGNDTIRHTGTVAATIDLTAATLDYSATGGGVVSYVDGIFGGFTIAGGVVVENATGGSGNDLLLGNSVRNFLNGGAGADTMIGRLGNDLYRVDNVGDVVTEATGEGTDLVYAMIDYTLGDNVENLMLQGTAIAGTGNALNNVMTGNGLDNILTGGDGHDTINGRLGADTMTGGAGLDTYIVDNIGDVVIEGTEVGSDLVKSTIDYTLGDNVERLTLIGTAAINGTGNGVRNVMFGNGASNELRGEGAIDTITGAGGADHIYGGLGNDRLTGGAGTDNFYFDTALNATFNVDTITDFAAVADNIHLDLTVFTALAGAGALAGGAFVAGAAALDADDRIIYDSTTGKIYYDADGNGAEAAVQFAQIKVGANLSAADFFAY